MINDLVKGDPSDHARRAKDTGRLEVVREVLAYPDRVIALGVEASKMLNRRGDSSEED